MGLELVELVMAIEDEFDIEIPDRGAGELRTVGLLTTCVIRCLDEKGGSSHCPADLEVADRVRLIISKQLGVPADQLEDETDFVRDLRCG